MQVLRSKEKAGSDGLSKCKKKKKKRGLHIKEIYLLVLEPNELLVCLIHNMLEQNPFFGHLFLPGGSDGKESACNIGNAGSIPGSERSPGEGNGNPLQYSSLGNFMNRGA